MSRSRSTAYWATNRYPKELEEPAPTAPLQDLPTAQASRFRALRGGLLALDGVGESVRYMGAAWRWTWEYGLGNRKLCWVHVMEDGLSATFTLSEAEEARVRGLGRMPAALLRAIAEGQRTGPVKWCWVELSERRAIEEFLRFAGRKAEWLGERPSAHPSPRLRGRAASGMEEEEAD
jgi:hypothetical protein